MPPNEEQQPTLEQVIDTAIADASPTPPENNDNGDDDGSAQGSETPDTAGADENGAAEAGAGGDADGAPGDGSEDPGAARAGEAGAKGGDDAKGKDGADPAAAGSDAAAKKAAAAAAGDAGDPKAKGAPKQPDPVNDPIPEDVKGKTRTRMTALIDTAKTATKELEESRSQTDGFLKAIAETGADPEGFARHVEVLRMMNSADPIEQRAALKALRIATTKLAADLGEREPGKELEGHDDLAEEVENGDITRARAIEIANTRNAKKAEDARAARAKQEADAAAGGQAEVATARGELNALEQQLAKADPLYYRKRAAIENTMKALIPTIPPKQWPAAFKRLLDTVDVSKLPRVAPRVGDGGRRNVPAGTGDRQPMRPRQGAGGGPTKAPTNIAEAIDFGIAQADARR